MAKLFLLADDDFDDAELFGEAVTNLDPPVDFLHVEDGQAMVKFLQGHQEQLPDIIFLDINMALVSGWDCLNIIKNNNKYRDIPVIMYSTSESSLDKQKAKKLQAAGFLTKPSDFRNLVVILKKLVAAGEVSLWEA